MNHPEKIYVAGSGMKNRYRTIIPSKSYIQERPTFECKIVIVFLFSGLTFLYHPYQL